MDPDEPMAHGRFVGVREPESSERTGRLLEGEDGAAALRGLAAGWPDIALTRENETMILGKAVFAGNSV